jgi:hypothetical protein
MTTSSLARNHHSFRGEFDGLAAMMQQSWADNPSASLLYSEEFLRSMFEYPGSSFDLAPAVYGDSGLLGFVAGFPRSVLWDARQTRIIVSSFLTASNAVKRLGLAFKLWADLIERSRERGYDGTINFCVEGDEMNRMMLGLASFLKLNTRCIFSMDYMVRLLRSAPPAPIPPVAEAQIDLFLELASELNTNLPLVRQWTRAEAEWQCRDRSGAIAVSYCAGDRRGMLTGYMAQALAKQPIPVVLLEDLLWGNLEPAERVELVERFLRIAAARGARTASCPVLGYTSYGTLSAAKFRRSGRVLHAYLTMWNGLEPHTVPGLYIDVF